MPSYFECKGQQPQVEYAPVYLQCWGLGKMPDSLLLDIGPMVKNPNWPGDDMCNGFQVADAALRRQGCTYTYAWSGNNTGIVLTTGSYDWDSNAAMEIPISDQIDQNPLMTDPGGRPRWYIGPGTATNVTSWCSRVDGETTLEITGTYETETCVMPFRIHYKGP